MLDAYRVTAKTAMGASLSLAEPGPPPREECLQLGLADEDLVDVVALEEVLVERLVVLEGVTLRRGALREHDVLLAREPRHERRALDGALVIVVVIVVVVVVVELVELVLAVLGAGLVVLAPGQVALRVCV